jgi:GGDEF domain-containing protein
MKNIRNFFLFFKNYIFKIKELEYLAYHDSLTRLLNRNWLYKNINSISNKYVYFIDINNLHEINKQGHTFGDNYIKQIIIDIQNKLNKSDIFIRYAGDEFIIFSDTLNLISNTEFYMVGFSKIYNSVQESINLADNNMIQFKLNRNEKRN